MMRVLGKRSCEDVVAVLQEYFEGSLEPRLAKIIERHLKDCPDCEAFARTYATVIKLTGELPVEHIPDELRMRVRRALRERFAPE
ncbi:MAG: zf-HC2 domain-containing protein [Gemmatimonadaceae bacterium]|nr:zf-HC2 domain-containing protein [Gemmatimonadaceae bacterium]